MSELTLDALGFRADEAHTARRIHDLTTPHAQRAATLRIILGSGREMHGHAAADRNRTLTSDTRNHEA
jgi:hypothetical protein